MRGGLVGRLLSQQVDLVQQRKVVSLVNVELVIRTPLLGRQPVADLLEARSPSPVVDRRRHSGRWWPW